jgi:hypothetical protein
MSAFAGEAEIIWSLRDLPILTPSGRRHRYGNNVVVTGGQALFACLRAAQKTATHRSRRFYQLAGLLPSVGTRSISTNEVGSDRGGRRPPDSAAVRMGALHETARVYHYAWRSSGVRSLATLGGQMARYCPRPDASEDLSHRLAQPRGAGHRRKPIRGAAHPRPCAAGLCARPQSRDRATRCGGATRPFAAPAR